MNYIQHLNKVFELFYEDTRLNTNHISLYMALFQHWNMNRFRNPVSINRAEIMKASKIGSISTYIRVLKDLHTWKYIEYQPSYNPHRGSLVNLYIFDTGNDTTDGKAVEQLMVTQMTPLININKLKKHIKEREASQQKKENLKNGIYEFVPESKPAQNEIKFEPPSLEQVQEYFKKEKYPELEATKFYNYFESNGWKVGGKSPMKNWNAAAINWMLNSTKYNAQSTANETSKRNSKNAPSPGQLNTGNEKDYGEPL